MISAHMMIDPVRRDICTQIEALRRQYRELSITEIGRRTDRLRHMGKVHGFDLVHHVAGGLSDALARDGRSAIIADYLQSLSEAARCDAADAGTRDLFLASIGVRLAG